MDPNVLTGIVITALSLYAALLLLPTMRRMPDRAGTLLEAALVSGTLLSATRLVLSLDLADDTALRVQRLSYAMFPAFAWLMFEFSRQFGHRHATKDFIVRLTGVLLVAAAFTWPSFSPVGEPPTTRELTLDVVVGIYWITLLIAVGVRLFRDARKFSSPLIRNRLRLLAFGASLVGLSFFPSTIKPDDVGIAIGRTMAAIALLLMALAFAPPRILRAGWRRDALVRAQLATGLVAGIDDRDRIAEIVMPVIADLIGANRVELLGVDGTPEYVVDESDGTQSSGASRRINIHIEGRTLAAFGTAHAPVFGNDEIRGATVLASIMLLGFDRCDRIERERADVDRILEADHVKDTFLAAVSHDVRNPLGAIKGFARLLSEDGDRLEPAMRTKITGQLVNSTARIGDILDSLLDLTRMTPGRIELDLAPVDLIELARNVVEHATIRSSTVTVVGASNFALVDRTKLERVLENLVHNADRHTPAATNIRITVAADLVENDVLVHVDDDGPGIPADKRAQLFTMFERDEVQAGSGTGIGLAIVARLTELHGGSVEITDSPLGGARFTVRIPVDGRSSESPGSQVGMATT